MVIDIAALLTQVRHALQTGQAPNAEKLCRAVLAEIPDHPQLLHMLGLSLALQHEYHEALNIIEKAAQLQPGNEQALFDLAHTLHKANRSDEAVVVYRRVMKLVPAWSAPWINLGSLLISQDKAEEAIDLLQRGLLCFPNDADLANTLGNAFGKLGYYQEALDAYRKSARLAPTRPDILHNQSYALYLLGDHATALTVAKEGLHLSPEHLSLKVLAGDILCQYRPTQYSASLADLLVTALKEGWSETAALSSSAWHLLELAPEYEEWPNPISAHPLLLTTLRYGLVNHPHWETRLTDLRKQWLSDALSNISFSVEQFEILTALAEQCFHNEYAFTLSAVEESQLDLLTECMSKETLAGQTLHSALAIYAAYRPLITLPPTLLKRDHLPPHLDKLFRQQVSELQEEAEIATTLPGLTPIDQGLSSRVQQQYEESPYPRWNSARLLAPSGTPSQAMTALFPYHAPFTLPNSPKILIAGTEVPSVFRLPRGGVHATSFSPC